MYQILFALYVSPLIGKNKIKLYLALRKLDPLMKGALQDASLAIAGKAIRSCSSVCYLHYISSFALPELAMRRRLGKRGLNKRNCRLVEFDHSRFLSRAE